MTLCLKAPSIWKNFCPAPVLAPKLYWGGTGDGGEGEGLSLGLEDASQECFHLRAEPLGEEDVKVDVEVPLVLGVLGQWHSLPWHHFVVLGAAKQRRGLRGAVG